MRRTLSVVVLVACSVVAIALVLSTQHRTEAGLTPGPSVLAVVYLADGNPQPPLPSASSALFIADGNPQPPPLPPPLVADGNPQPPLPPIAHAGFLLPVTAGDCASV